MHGGVVEKLRDVLGSEDFERTIPVMYVDGTGLVTVGIGFLINTPWEAKRLNFRHIKGDRPALKAEIEKEWYRTHALGPGRKLRVPNPTVELPDDEIEDEFERRANQAETILTVRPYCRKWYGNLAAWPADAQLGILAMAWSGPGQLAGFTEFRKACAAGNWKEAAKQSHMKVRRQYNEFFARCFLNAYFSQQAGLPITKLLYPTIAVWKEKTREQLEAEALEEVHQ
jgi:hypothetical protein